MSGSAVPPQERARAKVSMIVCIIVRGKKAGNESADHSVDKSASWQAKELERNSTQD
jgi:hypothetical protein